MKTVKIFATGLAVLMALSLSSCKKTTGDEKVSGTYEVTANVETVDYNKGHGVIFGAMESAVNETARNFSFRTDANDKAVIAAADKAAKEHENQSDIDIVISVVFKPGNVSGQAENKPIVIKSYTFKGSD